MNSIQALIPRNRFSGLDDVAHLCAGGESPVLTSHQEAVARFFRDKGKGEIARTLEMDLMNRVRERCGALFSVPAGDITFLSSASEGINNVAYGLDWNAGDNVVVADVEFPSGVYPWTMLASSGVEIRVVRHRNWHIALEDIAAQIDDRTRLVAISHVSMFTGQRLDLPVLSRMVRDAGALLLLDATHAAGVVPVDASLADFTVSSCYKWLLGVHGAAIFHWNRERVPDFRAPFPGWNSSARSGGWRNPTEFTLHDSADRFLPGNPGFISLYILDNALETLMPLGLENIERHALTLSGEILAAVKAKGWELMTPAPDAERAGNVCFLVPDVDAFRRTLEAQGVLVWGAYASFGRVRISTHVYNDGEDVARCVGALASV